MADNKKITHVFSLMERLAKGEELYPQNLVLLQEFGVNDRTMRRYLDEIHSHYGHIVLTEKKKVEFSERKTTIYRVPDRQKDISETFAFFLEHSDDLGWLIQLIHENNTEFIKDPTSKKSVEKVLKRDKGTFLFKSSPFENIENPQIAKIFNSFKTAVQNHEYRKISYKYREQEVLEAKCLKLVYMNNNWYAAIEDESKKVRLLRLAFIETIKYSLKTSYQLSSIKCHKTYFDMLQNPMTLEAPIETAILRTSKKIAIYFRADMKKFFHTQTLISENDDGGIDFSIRFTQPMEILPFIKQWLPDITIVSPENLKNAFKEDLQEALKNICN
jgi:hypothetical protein